MHGSKKFLNPVGTAVFASSSDGVRIAYEKRGEGDPALVFVHGSSCDRSYWSQQLEPFARDFQVVAVDLAGHGESGLERNAWTIPSFGDDVAAVVNELGLQRTILIGHSMGGDVIMEAARRLPHRVAALVWVDTYRDVGPPRMAADLQRFMAPFRVDFAEATRPFVRSMFPATAPPSLVARIAEDMSAAPAAIAVQYLEAALAYQREIPQVLHELNLPVIAINPEEPPSDAASLERHGIKLVSMPGVGHFLMLEDPARFNRILRSVIDDHRLPRP